ncbi:hypothetical protein D9756_007033 [Leucocoprinus leucothites]|uniref:Cytochrome P450 n=1 Tax=Leucocoprinus leucothites TaxID=201217 RepID=A0A8H5D837_9AGAR|nr:hypothetical protein D9756_007033 [Leucoagaricus leucothites]
MLAELMEWNWSFALMPYGTVWRRYRRAFHDHFHPNVVHKYHDVYVGTARAFLRRLLKTPDDFMLHVRHAFASTILKITYGMIISDDNDDSYVKTAEIALSSASEAGIPGRFLVDIFPAMKYIPAWVPGAGWKRKANYWRQISRKFVNMPWESVKERMKDGTAEPCVTTALIEKLLDENSPNWQDGDSMARNICAMSFAGGADTTVSTVQSYFMAMALYPEVQKKAQEELDRVLGGRLPEFNDRPNLPYINAMVKESMRWQPVTPVGLAHMASEADEYNGSILHDPEIYEDPLTYNPERFLKDGKIDPTVRNPTVASFGYGRRICPGRFLAEDSMFITISHILSDGKEIPIRPEMTNGTLSYPEPFVCRITPRSIQAEELIRNSGLMD